MKNIQQRITFSTAHWRIPSVKNAFAGILEGKPTEEEQKKIIEKTQQDQANWSPSTEAFKQQFPLPL